MAVVGGVVFFAVRASARPDPWLDGPDQEMGGRGRAVRRDLLSPAVGRRGCDPALVSDDGGGLDRGHGRPSHRLTAERDHTVTSRRTRIKER
jgi:hypothetical protein